MRERLQTAIAAARAAGGILNRGHGRGFDVREKTQSRMSVVTEIDLHSHEAIVEVLAAAFPDDAILSEEGTVGDIESGSLWVVDPLDGTASYAHGFPFYCVAIAYCDGGGVALAVVYDPRHDDLFTAVRGEGAFHNGQPMAVSATAGLRGAILATQVQSEDPAVLDNFAWRVRQFVAVARDVRTTGAPALVLAYVARGWLDAFCEEALSPWDTLAGALLITEAGGRVTAFDTAPRPLLASSDILASNAILHDDLAAILARR
ncbi:MAG: inositol monophosphatase [Rhodobiaceae bacterium]|nr:inositol monophosphatase [Rhodobiaceae bacterium]